MIHVCSLARLHDTVRETRARHVVTLLGDEAEVIRPDGVPADNHLWLRMHDISAAIQGYIAPHETHVATLIDFVGRWNRETPLVVHCYAGISRSTAAAFVAACSVNPRADEAEIAWRLRRASATALPNLLIVGLADDILRRGGRMVAAIEAIGRTMPTAPAEPFRLDLD